MSISLDDSSLKSQEEIVEEKIQAVAKSLTDKKKSKRLTADDISDSQRQVNFLIKKYKSAGVEEVIKFLRLARLYLNGMSKPPPKDFDGRGRVLYQQKQRTINLEKLSNLEIKVN